MKIKQAIRLAGSGSALAKILGVSRQAVCLYKQKGQIPETRVQQLRSLRPEWFAARRT